MNFLPPTMLMNVHDPVAGQAHGTAPLGHRLDNFELQGAVVQRPHGVVYRGWDHNLGIPVAIREYLPLHLVWRKADGDVVPLDAQTIDAFERGRHAFVNEARVLARCDHASLLRVRHLLHAHGTSYRVMPWYDGRTLLDVRHEIDHPPDEPALRALLADLLGALEAYHRVGGVHGGVRPSQILLLDDDRAVLLGPGAARHDTDADAGDPLMKQTEAGFLAPEQLAPFDESPTGPWTDIFALARVVRFCISGMLPPAPGGPSPEPAMATVAKLYFDAPGVHYSQNFLAALDAACSPDIDERPQTVAEFCDWLDHGPHRVPMSHPPAPPQAPPEPAPETRPAAVATVARREEEPDAETIALIQRVIEAIPARIELPPPGAASTATAPIAPTLPTAPTAPTVPMASTAPPEFTVPFEPGVLERPRHADRWHMMPPAAMPRRPAARGPWLLLAALVLSVGGYAFWVLQRPPSVGAMAPVAVAVPLQPAPESVTERGAPAAAVTAPAAPGPNANGLKAPGPVADETPVAAGPASAPQQVAAVSTPESQVTSVVVSRSSPSPSPSPSPPPAAAAAAAAGEQAAPPAAATGPDNPRAACGGRKEFSLYRCMQQQCAMAAWAHHPQCVKLKATDRVD